MESVVKKTRARKPKEAQNVELNLGQLMPVGQCQTNVSPPVGLFQLSGTATTPEYGTGDSACFDLFADLAQKETLTFFTKGNAKRQRRIQNDTIVIDPGDRILIPTGWVFDIPSGWQMKILSRSGNSLKQGWRLSNSVGTVDADYKEEVFVSFTNMSSERLVITHGQKIAQAEVIPAYRTSFSVMSKKPTKTTERTGGFGHTGN